MRARWRSQRRPPSVICVSCGAFYPAQGKRTFFESRKKSFGPPQQLVRVMAAAVSWRSVKATTINIPYVVSLLIQHGNLCVARDVLRLNTL